MKKSNAFFRAASAIAMLMVSASIALAQDATPQAGAPLPADPWPRDVSISNAALLIYQPQVNSWNDNQLDFRSALAIKPTGAKEETFGVVFVTARTQVDKVERMVVFENLQDHQARLSDAARSRRQLPAGAASAPFERREDDLARPAAVVARGGGHQAADGAGRTTRRRRSSSATRRRFWCRSTARRCSSRCPVIRSLNA